MAVNYFHMFYDLILSASAMTILSRLQTEQLSAFLGTELLILCSNCHLNSENSILFNIAN